LTPSDLPLFLLFATASIVLPGLALQRLVRTALDPALAVPLGTGFCALAFWLSLVTGVAAVFPAAIVALLAGAWIAGRGPLERASGPTLRGALAPALALVALLALTQYPWNRVEPSTGDFLLDPLVTFDSAFHVGLTHELLTGEPPQVPGVSGFPLGYHLGTDLVRAAARRWAGTNPWDSLTRLDVTLWGIGWSRAAPARHRPGAPPWRGLAPGRSCSRRLFRVRGERKPTGGATCCAGTPCPLVYASPVLPALGLATGALDSLPLRGDALPRPPVLAALRKRRPLQGVWRTCCSGWLSPCSPRAPRAAASPSSPHPWPSRPRRSRSVGEARR
jgi:hypothetical protein